MNFNWFWTVSGSGYAGLVKRAEDELNLSKRLAVVCGGDGWGGHPLDQGVGLHVLPGQPRRVRLQDSRGGAAVLSQGECSPAPGPDSLAGAASRGGAGHRHLPSQSYPSRARKLWLNFPTKNLNLYINVNFNTSFITRIQLLWLFPTLNEGQFKVHINQNSKPWTTFRCLQLWTKIKFEISAEKWRHSLRPRQPRVCRFQLALAYTIQKRVLWHCKT